ncbi:hypothetical protein Bcav_0931 [Beutenbergia cavernae DSM 12333]|uniref:Uncharacterized protein n=1 Tax=Beutenbergia cavernae (strain ATCC BAA-8 / DSM 12333 / CCUG 43141 / JCM 11478 / NBRC 16432 / NCIMB 13614 / HKI 0122) TaxID=471853 RepID=C5BZM0_BEUC1|nr:hypothetical protein Bcav_0931 [Beutenbergia cavernae DSM 12333]
MCLGILVTIALTQVLRPSPRDAALFAVVAAVLVVDRIRPVRLAVLPFPRAAVVVVLGLAIWPALALGERYGAVDVVLLSAVGIAAFLVTWRREDDLDAAILRLPDARRAAVGRAARGWAAVVVCLGLWELTAFTVIRRSAPGGDVPPSISDVLSPVFDSAAGRAVLVGAWLLAGYALLRRAGERR